MPFFIQPVALMPSLVVRSVTCVALLGATMLASPMTAARAETATNAAIQMAQAVSPQNPAAAGATDKTKTETVEERITTLHQALKITPDQESKWKPVAQAMRENATNMEKLIAATKKTSPQDMTAVEDLKIYQKFAQAHVDGLKNLIASFDGLYAAMPDAQKKIADEVFRTSRQ